MDTFDWLWRPAKKVCLFFHGDSCWNFLGARDTRDKNVQITQAKSKKIEPFLAQVRVESFLHYVKVFCACLIVPMIKKSGNPTHVKWSDFWKLATLEFFYAPFQCQLGFLSISWSCFLTFSGWIKPLHAYLNSCIFEKNCLNRRKR